MRLPRLAALLALLTLALALAACGDDDDNNGASADATPQTATEPPDTTAEPSPGDDAGAASEPADVTGGTTVITLGSELQTVLGAAGVDVGALGDAEAAGDEIRLPISAGKLDIDSLSGRVEHEGGISFTVGDTTIEASELAIVAEEEVLTAEIGGERVELFSLDFGEPEVPQTGDVFVVPAEVRLAAGGAADRINDALGVDILRSDLPVGDVVIKAQRP